MTAPFPILKRPAIEVGAEACQRLAALFASQSIPVNREETNLSDFAPKKIGNFYLWLVAVCHFTSPQDRLPLEGTTAGQRKLGWDYLSARSEAAARADRSLLVSARWAPVTSNESAALFRDPEGAVELIRHLRRGMKANNWPWVDAMYEFCGGRTDVAEI